MQELREYVDVAISRRQPIACGAARRETLVSQAVKPYAAVAEEAECQAAAVDETISATEAVVVACALMRAHRLNPFDLAIWSSRSATGGNTQI